MGNLSIFGKMGKNMKDNGEMGLSMEVEFGNLVKEIAILANGSLGKLKVMEFILHQMVKDMRDIFKTF